MRLPWLISLIVQVLVAFLACLLPALFQVAIERFDFDTIEYTLLQFPNWMWTLTEAFDDNLTTGPYVFEIRGSSFLVLTVPWGVFFCGLGMYLLHLFLAAGETEKRRLAAPQRVREEDHLLGRDKRPTLIEI